jgi:hypothetical protein
MASLTSGLISAVVGVIATLGLSFVMPPPWDLGRAMICVAIASFAGSVLGFQMGRTLGKQGE